ncbi:MAG: triose-phosphate isomerase [Myxococcales bacterium]|nr:triose-phosphate isomerase [Myxococcales bacterium]
MTSRTPLIAGNWKLHNTIAQSVTLATALRAELDGTSGVEIAVAPVATALHPVASALEGSPIALAAQNTHWESRGAFTGELGPALLADVGCRYVIVGHSERRQLFGETEEGVRKKVRAVQAAGLVPIVCVGETLAQREEDATLGIVLGQVDAALAGNDASRLVIAYEPVWAIGTGKTASPADAQAVHAAIRGRLSAVIGELAQRLQILYGGSVKAENARDLLSQPDIDGALVGGASLEAKSFTSIVRAAL